MSMKIYFAGSIRGGRDDAQLYYKIVKHLQDKFGQVLTEHVASLDVKESGEQMDSVEIHDRDMAWLTDANVLVAEVTQPSLGVGYEIGRAVEMKKPILCLFRPSSGKHLSAMIGGAVNIPNMTVKYYEEAEVINVINEYFAALQK
ncbi:hypothetical protein CAPTEDRAFT_19199 [Capitella teleta]|uniref:Putative 2'-deoxynucleoside 5'-phosphate N-hydrolase 1 n=1 Tax=Capitella teleta TaxID=283909 RepID=R7TR84_CAPTE|nr:hypothetical protein CAPTEDRAFT_19199 [Capitella teleta]|eukprot:ELT93545.1 hypothetical protein CAPTEDRAFT_19199 [Capitella teleta]